MKEIIEKVLRIAVEAPSGHNYQPWSFNVKDDTIELYNLARDTTIYNFKQRGSYIAHGAVIENIRIAAGVEGYDTAINLFPNQNTSDLVASITLEKSAPVEDPLYSFISRRSTNRKPYKKIPLNPEAKAELVLTGSKVHGPELRFVEDSEKIKVLAKCFSLNERLVFENYNVHQSLFPHILWTEAENAAKKIGLYIKTLELAPPAKMAFSLIRYWQVARLMGKLGMGKAIAAQNAKLYASASAIGLISASGNSHQDFIQVGRFLQRMWLKTESMRLSIQPLAALVYMGHRIAEGDTEKFSVAQTDLIMAGYKKIAEIFDVSPHTMALPFRIGFNSQPSARSLRLPPQAQM